ncbi:YhcN/YlaJ family sporulation lipoprotein [Paenibacillus ehimensis]|uniref:YhcN/YlaJ family sporulation lipoprotein n=2 Tax=Paenibacillus ehimensis TaxID=79264 RepID=A0ABT8VKC2_9BACL|nr:YhcN/YlaJ family sporulation lipoprotein [Paenibacillus ehimensis]MDO3681396.1 YhcN/YlaJ family sporulation lipoprotein [Paenibacillus ehimensis]MEC0213534.1 YhcN/YlaJ family sporulation lipoprotein [Paenibacillus ehimensis]
MMRYFRWIGSAAALGLAMTMTGCFSWYDYNSANNYGSKRDMPRQDTSRAYQTQQQYAPVSHKVTKLELNQHLSDQVAAMDGVNSAIVMMGDNVAYVAITMDSTASGTRGGEGKGTETNNYGLVKGLYSTYGDQSDYAPPDQLISGGSGGETEIHHEHLSHLFKQKIAEKIRLNQPTVHDVYISANRNVVNAFNRMAQDSWSGRSLEPYRAQFTEMMERTFGTDVTIPNQAEGNGREY